jgi:hypothetical protein
VTRVASRVELPAAGGGWRTVELAEPREWAPHPGPYRSRVAFAAAHVVADPWGENVPGAPAALDWDATLAFRRHLFSYGLGVAEAMDTAQRNMGLDWAATAELIRRSAAEARAAGGDLVVGVNTDHLDDPVVSLDEVISAYLHQLEVAEEAGAGVVLMASRHLARAASSAADYERVYREVIARAGSPVVLHWLGTAFDVNLAGYWGSDDVPTATDTVVRIMGENAAKVRGIKMSLLNAESEIAVRRRLPEGTTMFTGDDYNYVSLIEGDEVGHSDALLGAFAALAPSASAALQALDRSDAGEYRRILGPTEALARQIFAAPTQYYKTGVAFLSWLNGHQQSFTMVGGLHSGRSLVHLSEIVRLANDSGALERPAARWHGMLGLNGIPA